MNGKLVMSIEMLRVIEEYSADSTQLQQNFAIADECGTSSMYKLIAMINSNLLELSWRN